MIIALGMGMKRIAMLSGPQTSPARFTKRQDAYYGCLTNIAWSTASSGSKKQTDSVTHPPTTRRASGWTNGSYPPTSSSLSPTISRLALFARWKNPSFHVPKDISVIGFDDINFARLFTPALTTIRQDKQAIGETAVELLLHYIQHPEHRKESTVTHIPVEIVIRDSTRKFHE
ncbi:MAG: substrate-binding domain-containing protein [Bacillus subtilis]|nr:substrate-binding domain-containing protein [Bacillus subtilis]